MSFSIRAPSTRVSIGVRFTAAILIQIGNVNGDSEIPPYEERAGWGIFNFLEERSGAAFPALSVFFGDIFHVGDIGSGLRQYVMQVVADADEGESLFQKLAYS